MSKTITTKQLEEFQDIIGYYFKDINLLITALTHSSYANESRRKVQHNERLEFLGDSILSLIISEYLYNNNPDYQEGSLSKIRASVVSEASLADIAGKLQLGKFLQMGKGEDNTGGRERASILADAVESIIAAIYLDEGYSKARDFVLTYLQATVGQVVAGKKFRDYKTELQEYLQKESSEAIEYCTIKEKGPDHDKSFVVQVLHGKNLIGTGAGRSKKEAEQNAAEKALEQLYE